MTARRIEDVLAEHNESLMAVPGVVGTAIGVCDGAPCIRVFFRSAAAAERAHLAPKLDGYPVRAEVTGRFDARSAPPRAE
jgi:hypothetical protein